MWLVERVSMPFHSLMARWSTGLLLILTACVSTPTDTATPFAAAAMPAQPAPQGVTCPPGLPNATRCHSGRDSEGAFVLIAIPQPWNGHLVDRKSVV